MGDAISVQRYFPRKSHFDAQPAGPSQTRLDAELFRLLISQPDKALVSRGFTHRDIGANGVVAGM
jgi:hypothetical protein